MVKFGERPAWGSLGLLLDERVPRFVVPKPNATRPGFIVLEIRELRSSEFRDRGG